MKKKFIIYLILILFVCCIIPIADAKATEIQPRWNFTQSISADLRISSWGIATCGGHLIAQDNVPVELVLTLKQYDNGSWVTIKSWTNTGTANLNVEKIHGVVSGHTYKVVATGYVYDSAGNLKEAVSASKTVEY